MKYRVPSVPLALSSLRDRAAPVDSTYSRISLRFWYDGVSRDLCKMVRSSLGSFSAWSTLYLTRAQPWRAGGPLGATPPPPHFLFRGLRSSGGRSRDRRGPSCLTDAFPLYFSSKRARANKEMNARSSRPRCFGIPSSSEIPSKLDNAVAWCMMKRVSELEIWIIHFAIGASIAMRHCFANWPCRANTWKKNRKDYQSSKNYFVQLIMRYLIVARKIYVE